MMPDWLKDMTWQPDKLKKTLKEESLQKELRTNVSLQMKSSYEECEFSRVVSYYLGLQGFTSKHSSRFLTFDKHRLDIDKIALKSCCFVDVQH